MNLISKIRKSALAAAMGVPAVSKHLADEICDLEALAAMLQQLQARNQQDQRAIDALIAARRIVNRWDPKPEPASVWSVRRDLLASMGDQDRPPVALTGRLRAHGRCVVLPMGYLASLWRELYPAEQCRLAKPLIERVVVADGSLEIVWRDQGWQELAGELMPGTIGAELEELDETG